MAAARYVAQRIVLGRGRPRRDARAGLRPHRARRPSAARSSSSRTTRATSTRRSSSPPCRGASRGTSPRAPPPTTSSTSAGVAGLTTLFFNAFPIHRTGMDRRSLRGARPARPRRPAARVPRGHPQPQPGSMGQFKAGAAALADPRRRALRAGRDHRRRHRASARLEVAEERQAAGRRRLRPARLRGDGGVRRRTTCAASGARCSACTTRTSTGCSPAAGRACTCIRRSFRDRPVRPRRDARRRAGAADGDRAARRRTPSPAGDGHRRP